MIPSYAEIEGKVKLVPKFDHPLGIPTTSPRKKIFDVGMEFGLPDVEFVAASTKDMVANSLPVRHGAHVWTTSVVHPVIIRTGKHDDCGNPECDGEAMTIAVNPMPIYHSDDVRCIICSADATPETVKLKCAGRPDGTYVPTRHQFFDDWTDKERMDWLATTLD